MGRKHLAAAFAAAVAVALTLLGGSAESAKATDPLLPADAAGIVPMLSGEPMLLAAQSLGITTIMGKPIDSPSQTADNPSPKRLVDVPIANTPADENEPSVATNPKNKQFLVAGNHVITGTVRCGAYRSSDGGMTWSPAFLMPQETPASQCSDPVIAYAPDGSRVYYAYMDIKGPMWDIVVSYSDDNGATWIGPFIALAGTEAFVYDKPWIATPLDDSNYVYVTATRFYDTPPFQCEIAFTRSTTKGTSYEPPRTLESSGGPCGVGAFPVVQGSRPSGGKNGNLIVAWYNSGNDGWLVGSFEERVRHSSDFGASFDTFSVAATDKRETDFFLQGGCYHRWWASMFPDVEIDNNGSANLVYTHDPTGPGDAEAGDIRYVASPAPPYAVWSPPVTVNDDASGRAQGFAALDTQTQGTGQSAVLYAMWEDHRLSPAPGQTPIYCDPAGLNLSYDEFFSYKPPGEGWKPNVRVSDTSSVSDIVFKGDYLDLSVSNGSLFGIWTDRRDKLSPFDTEDDVWGSRVIVTSGTP